MPRHYLVTYHPLCGSRRWTDWHRRPDPPFADGSIRREPDFLSRRPSISALCRAGKFAPKLQVGDQVVYMTCKRKYLGDVRRGWRLVAALEIIRAFKSHEDAAAWYRSRGLPVPSNCMVTENSPMPRSRSHTWYSDCSLVTSGDARYRRRARKFPSFLACRPLRMDLANPNQVLATDLHRIFGRIPGTQSGCSISSLEFNSLLSLMAPHVVRR